MQIRPFAHQDEEAVIQLWQDSGLVVAWNDPQKDIARKLNVHPELFLVVEKNSRVIATVMGGYEGHRGSINYLAVDAEHRRTGIGKKLINHMEAQLTARGCPKINLFVRSTNTEVINWYRELGYSIETAVALGKRLIPDD